MLERLRSKEGEKVAVLHFEMNELLKDVDSINAIGSENGEI